MAVYDEFYSAFVRLDKEACVSIIYRALSDNTISIFDLYEGVLRRSLEHISDKESDPTHKIWKEHIQSSIVRTVLEMAFPFVLKQRGVQAKGRAAIVCPDQEQHELGARMVSDYMTLLGYQTWFVGRNTPKEEFNDMIGQLSLDVVALSVTNYFNLSAAIKTVDMIQKEHPAVKILAGGRAIEHNPDVLMQRGVIITRSMKELSEALNGGTV